MGLNMLKSSSRVSVCSSECVMRYSITWYEVHDNIMIIESMHVSYYDHEI